jgi:DNA mismatch endonuclease (patch repair protein)
MARDKRIVSLTMSRIRSKDTKFEKIFRSHLWKKNIRFRKNSNKHFGKPDVVIANRRVVIFLDSCFWHKCKQHFRKPTSNLEYWESKIKRNVARDKKVNQYYSDKGWVLIRVWEHDIKNIDLINKIVEKVK